MPARLAVDTYVLVRLFLHACNVANRALAAQVQPVAVSIQAILDMLFVDCYVVVAGDAFSLLPRLNFLTQKVEVAFKRVVAQLDVTKFVQQCPDVFLLLAFGYEEDFVMKRRPAGYRSVLERDAGVV